MGTIYSTDFSTVAALGLTIHATENTGTTMMPRALLMGEGGGGLAIAPVDPPADQQVELVADPRFSISGGLAILRYTDGANNYLIFVTAGAYQIYRRTTALGTYQLLAQVSASLAQIPRAAPPIRPTYRSKVTTSGANAVIELFVDGVSVLSTTDAPASNAAGRAGIYQPGIPYVLRAYRVLDAAGAELYGFDLEKRDKRLFLSDNVAILKRKLRPLLNQPGLAFDSPDVEVSHIINGLLSNVYVRNPGFVEIVFRWPAPWAPNGGPGVRLIGAGPMGFLANCDNPTTVQLYDYVDGTHIEFGGATATVPAMDDGADHTLRLELNGTTVRLFLDDMMTPKVTATRFHLPMGIPMFRLGANSPTVAQLAAFRLKALRALGGDNVAPAAPKLNVGEGPTTGTVKLAWGAPAADVTRVQVLRNGSLIRDLDSDLLDDITGGILDAPGSGTHNYEVKFIDFDGNAASTTIGPFKILVPTLPVRGASVFPRDGVSVAGLAQRQAYLVGPDKAEGGTVQFRMLLGKSAALEAAPLSVPVGRWESWASGDAFGSAAISRGKAPFNLAALGTLTLQVDGGATQTVTFLSGDFVTPGAATAAEVAAKIDAATTGVTVAGSLDEPGKVLIVRTAGRTAGSVQVTGGTALPFLGFDTFLHGPVAFERSSNYVPFLDPALSTAPGPFTWAALGTADPGTTGVVGTNGASAQTKEYVEDGVTDGTTAKVTSLLAKFTTAGATFSPPTPIAAGNRVVILDPAAQAVVFDGTVLSTPTLDTELLLSGVPPAGAGLIVAVVPEFVRWTTPTLEDGVQVFHAVEGWTGEVV